MMAAMNSAEGISLKPLLQGMTDSTHIQEHYITGIQLDSRLVKQGDLFLALHGQHTSGVNYIEQATKKGAVLALVNAGSNIKTQLLPVIEIENLSAKAGLIISRFYNEPSKTLNVTGITGTNGKTSVCHFVSQILNNEAAHSTGCIGTLGYGLYPELIAGLNTTPDAVTIQSLLASFREQSATHVVMEVSSHALEQNRITGVQFDTAVFTNLSHEHLDYHGDMTAYANAKRKLFLATGLQYAVINVDDKHGRELIKSLPDSVKVFGYGIEDEHRSASSVNAQVLEQSIGNIRLLINTPWGSGETSLALTGVFNVYNALAALTVLCLNELPLDRALQHLSALQAVPGRMETFMFANHGKVIVDYAHTADALEQSLSVLRDQCKGKLICVFGCGGDRDKAKRSQMGIVAERYADHIILTNDNPRGEDAEQIINDIISGMQKTGSVEIEMDRAVAISTAIDSATHEDIVLIAGKGHETYQDIAGVRTPYSDRQLVRNLLGTMT